MKRKIFLSFFIILTLAIFVVLIIVNYPYSSGSRSGRLVKLSKKGWLFKTYEGTLDMGSGDKLTWNFSIRNEKLGDEMVKSMGDRITVKYKELIAPIYYETKFNVTNYIVDLVVTPEARNVLCRFVNVIRNYPELTQQVRTVLERDDLDMLKTIRQECQGTSH